MEEEMNVEMMEIMVNDWLADHEDETADLVIDSSPYFDDDSEQWMVDCHDAVGCYTLVGRYGFIEIHDCWRF